MKIPFFLFFFPFLILGCGLSSNVKAISEDVCGCVTTLIKVNEDIEHAMNKQNQEKVMKLFILAGEEQAKAQDCILGLSNSYGKLDKKTHDKVLEELKTNCRDGVEAFEKSGWYPTQ